MQNRQKLVDVKIDLDKHLMNKDIILRDLVEKDLATHNYQGSSDTVRTELQSDITFACLKL